MRIAFAVVMGMAGLAQAAAAVGSTTVTRDSGPASQPSSRPASRPAELAQDGPGVYRASAGAHGEFTGTFRAKSREDAISIAVATVGKKAMDADENVNMNTLKVVKVGD